MLPFKGTRLAPNGTMLVLAYDHGLEHGPVDFESVPETVDPTTVFDAATHDAVTALAVGKGVAEAHYPSYEDDVALLAKLNGVSNLGMGEPYSPKNWSVENAVEVGADAIGYTIYAGSNHEAQMFEDFREVHEAAREHDLPVVVWSYPRGQGVKNDTTGDIIAYAARIAMELGADVTKVKYPGSREAMEWVVESAGATDVLMSGGSKVGDRTFLESVESVMDAGGAGLAVGRNVWQRDRPERILDALQGVVHEGRSTADVLGVSA